MSQKEEQQLIKACLSSIENKLQWGESSSWHNDVFIELSELIHSKTGVLLSPTTLKRVWGRVHYNSSPSISTLNALAKFIDYENWRDFKVKANVSSPNFFQKKIVPHLGIIVPSAAVLTLVFISLFSLTDLPEKEPLPDYSNVRFSSQPVVEGFPNSVIFDFDLEGIDSDSIHIQQFWDPTKTITIEKDQKQATGIYYIPGYFRSKLLVNGNIIKEHDLFIKSQGWLGTLDYKPVPKYFTKQKVYNRKKLSFPKEAIDEIATLKDPVISSFHLINDFGNVSGDNISIDASIENTYVEKWAVCQTFGIVILGTKGAHIIPFTKLGCISEIDLMLNDVFLSGKKNDLSKLGTNASGVHDFSVQIENKKVSFSFDNGEKIELGEYNRSIGNFVGIRFRFIGAGKVSNLKVSDLTNNKVIIDQE